MEDGQTKAEPLIAPSIDPFDRQATLAAALYLSTRFGRAFSWEVGSGMTESERALAAWFAGLYGATLGHRGHVARFVPKAAVPVSGDGSSEHPASELSLGRGAMSSLVFVLAAAGGPGPGAETLTVRGGTHSDPRLSFEHLAGPLSWLLEASGLRFELRLKEAGYGGERGVVEARGLRRAGTKEIVELGVPEALRRVEVVAAASGLANHLHQRLASEAASMVRSLGCPVSVQLMKLRARESGSAVAVTGRLGAMPVVSVAAGTDQKEPEALGHAAGAEFLRLIGTRDGFPKELAAHALLILAGTRAGSRLFLETLPPWWSRIATLIRSLSPRVPRSRREDQGVWLGFSE